MLFVFSHFNRWLEVGVLLADRGWLYPKSQLAINIRDVSIKQYDIFGNNKILPN